MCSTTAGRLTRICRAIEELAGQPGGGSGDDGAAGTTDRGEGRDGRHGSRADPGEAAADGEVAIRLAAIWAMIAEADPELAKRVPGYLDATD
jgi:hypothetical protein